MTQQMRSLMGAHDEGANLPEDQQEHPFCLAVERSSLARDIQTIYNDICLAGEVRLYVNKWVELSFCLPHQVLQEPRGGLRPQSDAGVPADGSPPVLGPG